MNRPEKRYDRPGWFCQNVSRLTSSDGLRSNGLSAGVCPPRVRWLPPPVPACRPSSRNFSVASPHARAAASRVVLISTSSRQRRGRVHVDLDHARIRGHRERGQPLVARDRVALEDDRRVELGRRGLDRREQRDRIVGVLQRRQEHEQVPVARLDGQRRRRARPRDQRRPPVGRPRRSHRAEGGSGLVARERRRIGLPRAGLPGERTQRQPHAER